jgi:hypothetical protein
LGKLEKDFVRPTAREGPHALGSTSIRTTVVFLPASAKLHLSHSTRWKSRFLAAGNCLSLSRRSPLMPSFWRQLTCWNDREHGHHALWSITSAEAQNVPANSRNGCGRHRQIVEYGRVGIPLWLFVPLAVVASIALTAAIVGLSIALSYSERSRQGAVIALEAIRALFDLLP